MKTSIIGRHPWGVRQFLITGLTICMTAGLFGGLALAVHDLNIFELDGNAVTDATPGDDWDLIYCDFIDADRTGVCTGVAASSALVSTFIFDPINTQDDDIFGGGSKDSINMGDNDWVFGKPSAKGDIEHAYAALYVDEVADPDEYILYFGMDRWDNNGDAALGFWFTQEEVRQEPDFSFSGQTTDGDILVQTDWPQAAGAVPRIEAYIWDSNCIGNNVDPDCVAKAQGGLKRLSSVAGTTCTTAGADDDLCAIANQGVQTAPWEYFFKDTGDVPTDFPNEAFFEGGINLSTVFPGGIPCISTFIAETRQSNSETAQLDDKLIGDFDLCSIFVKKEGPAIAKVSDPVTYTITIENNGALPLTKVSIIDSREGDLTAQCPSTLDPGASCVITYGYTVMDGDPDPLQNTVDVVYERQTATRTDTVTGSDSHEVNLFEPDVTLDKKADGSDGPVTITQGDVVDYTMKATNTSSADTPTLACTITDTDVGVDQGSSLTPGQMDTASKSVAFNFPTATPYDWCALQVDGTWKCTNTAKVECSPEGFENVVEATDTVDVIVVPAQVLLTVLKEGDAFGKVSDPVDYTITITNNNDAQAVTLTSIVDTLLGDLTDGTNPLITSSNCPVAPATLAPTASCTIEATRTVQAGDSDPLPNEVTVQGSDQFGNAGQAVDDHSVDLVAPSYTLSKSCVDEPVQVGEYANFKIDIVNDGDVNLKIDISDTLLGIDETGVILGERGGEACGDDDFLPTGGSIGEDAADGCLRFEEGVLATEPGELFNQVNVDAILPPPYCQDPSGDCELPNQIDKSAGDACDVEAGEVTRTWGFWKTHGSDGTQFDPPVEYGFTCYVFEYELGGNINLGWTAVTSCEQLFDIFWASKAKQSDGSKRPQLCQLQLQASRQLAAAILNTGLGTPAPTDPVTGVTIIEAMQAALAAGDKREIRRLMGDLADFNESGDDVAIETAVEIPHADPRGTRMTAETGSADC